MVVDRGRNRDLAGHSGRDQTKSDSQFSAPDKAQAGELHPCLCPDFNLFGAANVLDWSKNVSQRGGERVNWTASGGSTRSGLK